jgi:hypothetical protein
MRELCGVELEPEVRDWLDSLSDNDYKRVDEVCGLLAEKGSRPMKGRCEMTGRHTRWARLEDAADDPERIAIREALAFGKALHDIRTALGLAVAELAARASLTDDDIECIEEGGTEPTIPLLRRLASALNADVRLNGGHDLGSVCFETHAA